MNPQTEQLLSVVIEHLERDIQARDAPAEVTLDAPHRLILSDYDYLRDDATAATFEERAAAKARELGSVRWVFGVPQVWVVMERTIATRAVSNLPFGKASGKRSP